MSFNVKYLGVRGSLPLTPSPSQWRRRTEEAIKSFLVSGGNSPSQVADFLDTYPVHLAGGYGGNTSCVEVSHGGGNLFIDAGTGLYKKVSQLLQGPCGKGQGEVHLLLTHFHWDKVMALPFFTPLFIPGNTIHFYAVQDNLKQALHTIFKKPHFPIPYDAIAAKIMIHKLPAREPRSVQGFKVTPYLLDHPDECWGFRIEHENKVYSHCCDTEFIRTSPEELGQDLPLYEDVDLMSFDAQYSVSEATERLNWGHAAAQFGIDLGLKQGIEHMVFLNHDPRLDDSGLREIYMSVGKYYDQLCNQYANNKKSFKPLRWEFAVEDREIKVGD